jgi:hypothetical protein
VVERAVILCDNETFAIDETRLQAETRRTPTRPVALPATLVNQETEIIEAAMEETRAARSRDSRVGSPISRSFARAR